MAGTKFLVMENPEIQIGVVITLVADTSGRLWSERGFVGGLGGNGDGWSQTPTDIGEGDRRKCEAYWNCTIEELLEPQIDEWADDFIVGEPDKIKL